MPAASARIGNEASGEKSRQADPRDFPDGLSGSRLSKGIVMNGLARACWLGAAIYAAAGMIFGIVMSASGDHSLAAAHGHLNLLGWVSLALYGTFYSLFPAATSGWLARSQVFAAHVGVIVLTPGIVLAIDGTTEAIAKAGSVIILISMLLFAVVVARTGTRKSGRTLTPAE